VSVTVAVARLLENEITTLAELSPKDRAAKCQELAYEAKCGAISAGGTNRQTFIESAGIWESLAKLAEQEIASK